MVLLWIYLLIGLVVCVVGGAMALIYFTGYRMAAVHGPLMNAAKEIKLETATAHLWLEELISGDKDVTIDQVTGHIDQADLYANAMLKGGKNIEGEFVALTDPDMREDVRQVQEKLAEFRSVTLERWESKDTAGIGSEIDQQYDKIFSDLLTLSDKVETDVQLLIKQNLSRFAVQQVALVIISLIVTVTVSVSFGRFVFRQIEDEQKLIALNQQLDGTNQQLTASGQQLKAANQQLVANEQQLKAANQQLISSEQELRATNQQIVSSEQQLKASNQQLIANEQQLKAANQQLIASEQQLKVSNQQLMASEQQLRASNQQLIANEKRLRQSQRELREQRDKAQQYLDVAGVMFVVLNSDGDVTLINPKGCEILACGRDEVVGKNWFDNFLPVLERKRVKAVFGELMAGKLEPIEYYENPVLSRDGSERIIAWHNTILRDEQGQITGTLSSGEDITERKQAEERTRIAAQRLSLSIENMLEGYAMHEAIFDENGRMFDFRYLEFNPVALSIVGISREEIIGKTALELFPALVERGLMDKYADVIATGEPAYIEDFYYEGDNLNMAFDISCFRLDEKHFVCIFSDVTERKKAEQKLTVLSSVIEQSSRSIGIANKEGIIEYVNPKVLSLYGAKREDVVDKSWRSFAFPDSSLRDKQQELVSTVLQKGQIWRGEITDKGENGEVVWREATVFPIKDADGQITHIAYTSEDITERKRAQEELIESEKRYRAVVEDQTELICRYLSDYTITFVNDAYCRCFGKSRDELIGQTFMPLIPDEDRQKVTEYFTGLGRDKPVATHEHRVIVSDGELRWQRWINRAILDDSGNVVEFQGVGRDITEQKNAEDALRKSEQRFRALFESAPDAIFLTDMQGRFVDGNRAAEELIGYSKEELIGKTFAESNLLSPDQLPKAIANLQKNAEGELAGTDEFSLRRKDGSYAIVEIRSFPVEISNQIFALGIAHDITDRKQAEEELYESRGKLNAMLESISDQISMVDRELNIIWANKSCEEVFGTGVVGKKCYEVFHNRPNPCGRDNCVAVKTFEDGQSHAHESRVTDKNGRIMYQHTTANVAFRDKDGKPTAVIEVSRDITERKKAQEALAESEAKYRTLVEQIPSVTYVASLDEVSSTLYISPQIERLLGFKPEKWLKEVDLWTRQMHPDDHKRVLDQLKTSRQADEKFVSEYRMYAKDKRIVWIHDEAAVAKDQDGKALFVQGIMSDITERKQTEEALRESEKRFREFAELLPEIVGETNNQGRLTFVNRRAYDVFGYSREEMEGKLNVLDVLVPEDHDRASANIKRILAGEDLGGNDYTARKKDGSTFPITVYSTAILRDGKPAGIRIIIVDITRQRDAESQAQEHQAQLMHISRLSTVGEMASGLAHELNQPLSAIMSYANASLRTVKAENVDMEKVFQNLEMVALQSKRAGEIIRRIREFVRKQKPNREKVDANKLVKEVVSFVQADIRSNKVVLKLSLARKISKVNADSIQIEQVLLNLIRNAIEAMAESKPDQRKLTISTLSTKSKCIELAVSDTGHGLDDEILAQVFEPFFTTKTEGLGIGLSISRSIVEAHGGTLSAKSNPQGGSTFKFTLPITKIANYC